MTSARLSAALLALVSALSAPAAYAQSAGDDQYEDPFGDEAPQSATPVPAAPSPDPGPAPAPDPAASGSAPETAAGSGEGVAPAPVASSAAAAGELPRTGAEAGWLGAGGVALIVGGSVLRLRLARGAHRA